MLERRAGNHGARNKKRTRPERRERFPDDAAISRLAKREPRAAMADKVRREKRVQEAATDAIRENGNVVPDEHARFRVTRSVRLKSVHVDEFF